MKRIFKFPIPITDEFTVDMPHGAHVLAAQVQRGQPMMWALVDDDQGAVPMRFRLAGTGHPIEHTWRWRYVATFQTAADVPHAIGQTWPDGSPVKVVSQQDLVWHLFVDTGVAGDSYSVKPTVAIVDACPKCKNARWDLCGRGGRRCTHCGATWGAD